MWQYFYITKNSFEKYPFYFIQAKTIVVFWPQLYIWPGVLQYKNATMLWSSWLHFTIDWSFKMNELLSWLAQKLQWCALVLRREYTIYLWFLYFLRYKSYWYTAVVKTLHSFWPVWSKMGTSQMSFWPRASQVLETWKLLWWGGLYSKFWQNTLCFDSEVLLSLWIFKLFLLYCNYVVMTQLCSFVITF